MKEKTSRRLYLGLDTSAYTTSMALVDADERLVYEKRLPLPVGEKSLGLRQSEAVFAHLGNIPRLWPAGGSESLGKNLVAISSSTRPRPVSGSYMPVFRVGEAFGLFLAQTMGLIFLPSSHQEGHVISGLWSAALRGRRYLVAHFSGGTTEIVFTEETGPGQLRLEIVGGGEDLHAGQFVDRLGRAAGLGFPAGPGLEEVASRGKTDALRLPVAVRGSKISFSGPAAHAERLLDGGADRADLARAVEVCLADSLAAAILNLPAGPADYDGLLAVGGVMANRFIRERLTGGLPGWRIHFAEPNYSTDNAVGLAVQAARYVGG